MYVILVIPDLSFRSTEVQRRQEVELRAVSGKHRREKKNNIAR